MRIYAAADIHANDERVAHIRSVISRHSPDALVLAGDVISYFRPRPVFEKFNAMGVPVLMVRGNSDPGYVDNYFQKYSNLTSLHLNKVTVKSISFFGLSGTVPLPFRNKVRIFEKTLMDKAYPKIDSQTVLVVHTPPRGCLDQVAGRFHSGSKMVRELVDKIQPRLLICGHIHEAAGIDKIGETTVVNCGMPGTGKGMMIELTHGEKPVVEMV